MPITKATGYTDSKGVMHATVEGAQAAELEALLDPIYRRVCEASLPDNNTRLDVLASGLLSQRDALLSILTTGPTSRPGARKKAGTTLPKRAAKLASKTQTSYIRGDGQVTRGVVEATQAQATEGFKAMHAAAEGVAA